jgi:hypothetical protein
VYGRTNRNLVPKPNFIAEYKRTAGNLFHVLHFSPKRALHNFSSAAPKENSSGRGFVAQELCKPHYRIEERRVIMPARPLLHRVFNTCVENFTEPKHCNWTSAEFLLILRHQIAVPFLTSTKCR